MRSALAFVGVCVAVIAWVGWVSGGPLLAILLPLAAVAVAVVTNCARFGGDDNG